MSDCAILTVKYSFDAINATYSRHLLFKEIDRKGEIIIPRPQRKAMRLEQG